MYWKTKSSHVYQKGYGKDNFKVQTNQTNDGFFLIK